MSNCDICGQLFSRHQNMVRHIANVHGREEGEISDDEISETEVAVNEKSNSEESDEGKSDDGGTDNSADDESDDGKSEDSESDGENMEVEEENAHIYSMWTYLLDSAINDEAVKAEFEELKEKLDDGEMTDSEVAHKANLVVRPNTLRHINEHYANFLKIWHYARDDKYHKQIMRTKRNLMDMEEMSPVEAIEQAVKKRKYLIVKATGLLEDQDLVKKVPAYVPPVDEEKEEQNTDET